MLKYLFVYTTKVDDFEQDRKKNLKYIIHSSWHCINIHQCNVVIVLTTKLADLQAKHLMYSSHNDGGGAAAAAAATGI